MLASEARKLSETVSTPEFKGIIEKIKTEAVAGRNQLTLYSISAGIQNLLKTLGYNVTSESHQMGDTTYYIKW